LLRLDSLIKIKNCRHGSNLTVIHAYFVGHIDTTTVLVSTLLPTLVFIGVAVACVKRYPSSFTYIV